MGEKGVGKGPATVATFRQPSRRHFSFSLLQFLVAQ